MVLDWVEGGAGPGSFMRSDALMVASTGSTSDHVGKWPSRVSGK